jgi:hypothetical protein
MKSRKTKRAPARSRRQPRKGHPQGAFGVVLPADEAVLIPLYDACRAARGALMGVANQPRSKAAAGIIDDEWERMGILCEVIGKRLAEVTSVEEFWRNMYVETRVSHVYFCGGVSSDALNVLVHANALANQ